MATIQARITKVEHDVGTGWYSILTDDDSVKKLTTKMEQKAKQAAALKQTGELLEIKYSEKEGTNTNPHTGKPYVNSYYESAEVATPSTNGASADDGIDVVQPTGRKLDPSESWRIALSVGAKLAVATLPLMPAEQRDFDTQRKIALAWAMWVYATPPPTGGFATTFASAPEDPNFGFDSPPPHTDDEIPF